MRFRLLLLAGVQLLAVHVQAETPTAAELMMKAQKKAADEHKTIFVHFGASWCGWCKRLDAFLEKPEVKPLFEKHFIPVKLVVAESEKNKALENSGSEALLSRYGGPSGLPFSAFVDSIGSVIVNSKMDGKENIGYPATPTEIGWFVEMMKKAAPQITADDVKAIETVLQNESKAIENARNAARKS